MSHKLLIDSVKRAVESSENVPTPMIIVEAKNKQARDFYKNFGFVEIPVNPDKLLMTMRLAKEMLIKMGILF